MNEPTRYENWKWAEIGRCPACGTIGYEVYPCMDSEKVEFRCTRETCRTNYPRHDIFTGKDNPNVRAWAQTSWYERKPAWWRIYQQKEPYPWNRRFSQVFCLKHDLV